MRSIFITAAFFYYYLDSSSMPRNAWECNLKRKFDSCPSPTWMVRVPSCARLTLVW